MRRGISIVAAAAVLALGATACGGSDGDGGGKSSAKKPGDVSGTITWWDTSNSTTEAPVYKELVGKFEKQYPKIKVNYVNVPFDQAQNKFKTAAQAGKGAPDVIRSEIGWTPQFASLGYLQKLDGTPALDTMDDFLPGPRAGGQYQGKTYGVPEVTDTLALLYNKKLLQQAGIAKPPTTWDELKKDALTVKKKTGAEGTYVNPDSYFLWPFLYGEGTDMVDTGAKKITVNSPQGVKALQTARDLITSGAAPKPDLTNGYNNMQADFGSGKLAMIVNGPWSLADDFKGKAFKGDTSNLGIATVPAGSAGKAGAPTGGHALAVYAGSGHLDASYLFVKYMTSAQSQSYVAQKVKTLPTRKSAYTAAVTKDPTVAAFRPILASAMPRPQIPQGSDLFADLAAQYGKVLLGQESPQKGADETAKAWKQKFLKDYSDK
jgi:arabinogalactan oligomer / maltooligosaccharide transport system substrate-binding protein